MASELTLREVAHIADLARLALAADEQQTLARQLTDILAYANTIQQVETGATSRAAAMSADSVDDAPASLRADEPVPGLNRDEVLAEAPDGVREAGLFRVPKVI
jgi:aspartyl-tRNA(Asn)/glutamyl-tRNA(Gln) amidotransferase subunit C